MRIKPEHFIHPEAKPGEIFFTNASQKQFEEMSWKTKRLGKVSYDGKGNALTHSDWFPVFITEAELTTQSTNLTNLRKAWRQSHVFL